MLRTQSADPTSQLLLRITGRVMSCPGHLFDLQGRWHLRERTLASSWYRRFHISSTCFWLDPTSTLPKACSPLTRRSHSFLGLVVKVYGNSMLNGTTEISTSYYMPSYIASMSLVTLQIHHIPIPRLMKNLWQDIPSRSLIMDTQKSVMGFIPYMPEIRSQLIHMFSPIQPSNLEMMISLYLRINLLISAERT